MKRELSKEYIAGLFDGEGCIYLGKNASSPCCTITNTVIFPLKMVQNQYGGRVVMQKSTKGTNNKSYYVWISTGDKAEKFLNEILPYLIIKKERAKLALMVRARPLENNKVSVVERTIRKSIGLKIRSLNHKGLLPFVYKTY